MWKKFTQVIFFNESDLKLKSYGQHEWSHFKFGQILVLVGSFFYSYRKQKPSTHVLSNWISDLDLPMCHPSFEKVDHSYVTNLYIFGESFLHLKVSKFEKEKPKYYREL
jgi:hypothetical protein